MTGRPARILYVLNAPEGGASMSAYEIVRNLPRERFTPFVVSHPAARAADLERFRAVCEDVDVVFMPWWCLHWRSPAWRRPLEWGARMCRSGLRVGSFARVARAVRRWGIDLVHTNTVFNLEGAGAARLCHIPHVWHVREPLGAGSNVRFPMPDAALARFFRATADRVVCNSAYTAGFFRRHGVDVVVIPNAVDQRGFAESGRGRAVRARLGLAADVPLVGMCASLSSMMKRHDVFVDVAGLVAPRCPRARFVIFGQVPGPSATAPEAAYVEALRHRIEASSLGDRLVLASHEPDVPAMMGALDVLVHPCERESFGRVVVEAMAASRPVVGVAAGGVGEILAGADCGRVAPPGDVAALAEHVADLLGDASLRAALGARGRAIARERYGIDGLVHRLAGLYDELLQRDERARA